MTFCLLPVIPLLVAFQIDQGIWPPYASMMLIELYKTTASSSGYSVRVVYNGIVYKLPFCGSDLCDYKTFSVYLSTVTPSDPARQCLVTTGKKWRYYWTQLTNVTAIHDKLLCNIPPFCTCTVFSLLISYTGMMFISNMNSSSSVYRKKPQNLLLFR